MEVPFLETRMEVVVNMVAMLRPRPKLALAWAPSAMLLSYPMNIRFLVGAVAIASDRDVLATLHARSAPLSLPL